MYTRSPAAYSALKNLGLLNLPCENSLKEFLDANLLNPGTCENYVEKQKHIYNEWKKQCKLEGKPVPLNEGVLISDEVKVQGKIIWNSSSGKIIGLAITPEEFTNLHDVYMTLDTDRNSRPTEYVLQFLWRDISSKFDVIGPYYSSDKGMDSRFLLSCVLETMRVFEVYEFTTCGLVFDGASSNLKLAKHFCSWAGAFGERPMPKSPKKYEVPHKFPNPFRRDVTVYLIICPSHQVMIIVLLGINYEKK